MACLDQWRDGPEVKYSTGHRCDYYLECRGDQAAEAVRSKLREFGLAFETWGPQPEAICGQLNTGPSGHHVRIGETERYFN